MENNVENSANDTNLLLTKCVISYVKKIVLASNCTYDLYRDIMSVDNNNLLIEVFQEFNIKEENYNLYKKMLILLFASDYYKNIYYKNYRLFLAGINGNLHNHFESIEFDTFKFLCEESITPNCIFQRFASNKDSFAIEIIESFIYKVETETNINQLRIYDTLLDNIILSDKNNIIKKQLVKINPYYISNVINTIQLEVSEQKEIMFFLNEAYSLACDEYNYNKEIYDREYENIVDDDTEEELECDFDDLEYTENRNKFEDEEEKEEKLIIALFSMIMPRFIKNKCLNDKEKYNKYFQYIVYRVIKNYFVESLTQIDILKDEELESLNNLSMALNDELIDVIDSIKLYSDNYCELFEDELFKDVFYKQYIYSFINQEIYSDDEEPSIYDDDENFKFIKKLNPFKK